MSKQLTPNKVLGCVEVSKIALQDDNNCSLVTKSIYSIQIVFDEDPAAIYVYYDAKVLLRLSESNTLYITPSVEQDKFFI